MPHYEALLRDGSERSVEYDSGAAFVVAGDEVELDGELWRVQRVEPEAQPERLVCIRADAS